MLNADAPYALCEVKPAKIRHPNRAKRQRFPVPAWRFREARLQCGLGVEACAELLRISDRTIRNWESGTVRIPYAAYKLMRVLKGGKFLGPEWRDFYVWRGILHTPEGHRFEASELTWWSLLVRRARAFSELVAADRLGLGTAATAAIPARAVPAPHIGVALAAPVTTARPIVPAVEISGGFSPVRPVKPAAGVPSVASIGPRSNTGQKRVSGGAA